MIHFSVGADHVGRITLDRPEARNALTVEMRDDLASAVRQARSDPAVRSVLITGTGGSFCAGMDLRASTVSQAGTSGFDPRSTSEALRVGVQAIIRELWELDKPTVAAVDGGAVGPGAHLALACDFVLVHPGTRFIWSFARWGLVVDAGGAYLLPRLVGLPRAKALVLLGGEVVGAEAVDARPGLSLHRLGRGPGNRGRGAGGPVGRGPTRSLGLSKKLLNATSRPPCRSRSTARGRPSRWPPPPPEMAEGMAAFKEKRAPRFVPEG